MIRLSETPLIRVVDKAEAAQWVELIHSTRAGMAAAILLGGDRWSCVDQVLMASINEQLAGITTIATRGECMSGEPTIVAIYVPPEQRQQGLGYGLLEASIDHMSAQNLEPIRVDVLNSKMMKAIARLPEEKRAKLRVIDSSGGGMMDAMLDS